jgi:UDP-N-acetylmuramoyl-tripeptide--D-alanyl-D-alanine ligase
VNGIAIYNDKNPLLAEKIFRLVNRAIPYSEPTGVKLKVEAAPSDMMVNVNVEYQNKTYQVNTQLFGKHNIENIRAALAASLFLGAEMKDAVEAIGAYSPGNNRSQVLKSQHNTIICDSYNANPESMRRAVDAFMELSGSNKLLILGDMLELGVKSVEEHLAILRMLNTRGITDVILVGPVFKGLAKEFGFASFNDVDGLRNHLLASPVRKSQILVKGSRGIMLEKIYDLI